MYRGDKMPVIKQSNLKKVKNFYSFLMNAFFWVCVLIIFIGPKFSAKFGPMYDDILFRPEIEESLIMFFLYFFLQLHQ